MRTSDVKTLIDFIGRTSVRTTDDSKRTEAPLLDAGAPRFMDLYRANIRRRRLSKYRDLRFTLVEANIQPPYDVYWKVRNLGAEAARKGALRGEIKKDDGTGVLMEATRYTGEHYVGCYIVKDGYCVASRRTWVPIA
jgi:hypothetical protein